MCPGSLKALLTIRAHGGRWVPEESPLAPAGGPAETAASPTVADTKRYRLKHEATDEVNGYDNTINNRYLYNAK